MEAWSRDELENVIDEVTKQAAGDPELRKMALEDPASAIKRVTGREVPAEVLLRVIEGPTGLNVGVAVRPIDSARMVSGLRAGNCCQTPDALEICCAKNMSMSI